ncbi:Tat pathway signal sequence [Coniochaeta hoffmannii]|uniref:Tat pathway signal sequence n=1 Tax=Coniochaeta hoffmannii TaxID=91930 RepID=A0AA38RU72_9PEZI|nr:Tat pathway signal sequence [Coniochaeta hoffmannii]
MIRASSPIYPMMTPTTYAGDETQLGYTTAKVTPDLDTTCAAYTTQYSPVLKDAKIKYAAVGFNGTFMQEDIYRQSGSPEVDAAWEALGVDYRAGVIPFEEGLRSGLTSAHVQRSAKYGGGFFVNVEGLHHLHCLNLLRKSLYFNYPRYKAMGAHAFKNEDDILQLHVTHCLDTLRQVLMCNVDTGVLGQVWFNKDEPQAFPDFKTKHKCKDFDAIREWGEIHQAPPNEGLPPDYIMRPAPEDVLVETP